MVDVEAFADFFGDVFGGSPLEVNGSVAAQNAEFLEVAAVSVTQQHDPASVHGRDQLTDVAPFKVPGTSASVIR
jgi:hypothetical protein